MAPVTERHYENFPVASWLCPPALRPPIRAIYAFARTADDLADEGDVPPASRQADLALYRDDLLAALAGRAGSGRWQPVMEALAAESRRHGLPAPLLLALLDAFEEDTRHAGYADRAGLLHYCARSANPVGRLLLHLHGLAADPAMLARSDAICTALQLINFWQDLSVDLRRGRNYVPRADWARHGLSPGTALAAPASPAARALVADLSGWARGLMRSGAGLPLQVPGRVGLELRFVVQGGLRILEKIDRMHMTTSFSHRPVLAWHDAPALVLRALAMRRTAA